MDRLNKEVSRFSFFAYKLIYREMLPAILAKFLAFWLEKVDFYTRLSLPSPGTDPVLNRSLDLLFHFLSVRMFFLIGAGQVNVEICHTVLLPSGLLLRCLTLLAAITSMLGGLSRKRPDTCSSAQSKAVLARKLAMILHRILVDGTPFAADKTAMAKG